MLDLIIQENITKAFVSVLETFPLIDEIGYIATSTPTDEEISELKKGRELQTKTHPFVIEENGTKFGLPTWSLPFAFQYSKERLLFPEKFESFSPNFSLSRNLLSKISMITNPTWYSNYRIRKELLLENTLNYKEEIQLMNLIFFLPPTIKVSATWFHRKWITEGLLNNRLKGCSDFKAHVLSEIAWCDFIIPKLTRSYYVWEFLHWNISLCVEFLKENSQNQLDQFYIWLQERIEIQIQFISTHPSDSGSLLHLSQLFETIIYVEGQIDRDFVSQSNSELITKILKFFRSLNVSYPTYWSVIYGLENFIGLLLKSSNSRAFTSTDLKDEIKWVEDMINGLKSSSNSLKETQPLLSYKRFLESSMTNYFGKYTINKLS